MNFITEQVLGMKWLSELVTLILIDLGVDLETRMGGSVHFFIYDTIKIFILLGVLIFSISYIQSYFPPERTKKILGRFDGIVGNIIAALLGTVTPFCSCSSVPIFIGFTRAGLPLGVTFSFLISSPLVDVASILMLVSFFGWKIAIVYVIAGLLLAVVGGTLISHMGMQKEIRVFEGETKELYGQSENYTQKQRLAYAKEDSWLIVKNVYKYVLIGVGIGAIIHNWLPEEMILAVLGYENPFAVILATFIGVPIYADIFGTLPIAEALYLTGVPVGTILALMMSVTTVSLPSLIMLGRVLKTKLLAIFVGIVITGILITGYFFNYIQSFLL